MRHLQFPKWDLQQNAPSSTDLESFVLLNISGRQTRTLICLRFSLCSHCLIMAVYFYARSLSDLPLQDYLFRLVSGYMDSGKGKCSYDPKQENVAVLISKKCKKNLQKNAPECNLRCSVNCSSFFIFTDGNLYAGVHIDFMSTDAALFRTMGGRTAIRTEQYDSRWLNGE